MNTELVKYDAMLHSIAVCKEVDEVKNIRDKALALEAYAKQALNFEAERQCGIMLSQMEKAKGAQGNSSNQHRREVRSHETTSPKTLAQMNISKDQSSKWQKLAQVPEEEFERIVTMPGTKPSANTFIAKKEKPVRMDDDALFIWGTLRDLRQRNIFDRDLRELVDHWTQAMSDDAEGIIPKLQQWVNQYD